MRLQCFRLQKTQLGRKLLRICCSNLSCTPSTSSLDSQQWLWKIYKLGIGWSCYLSPIMMHSLTYSQLAQSSVWAELNFAAQGWGVGSGQFLRGKGVGFGWQRKHELASHWLFLLALRSLAVTASSKRTSLTFQKQTQISDALAFCKDCALLTLASRQQDCGQIVWCCR